MTVKLEIKIFPNSLTARKEHSVLYLFRINPPHTAEYLKTNKLTMKRSEEIPIKILAKRNRESLINRDESRNGTELESKTQHH